MRSSSRRGCGLLVRVVLFPTDTSWHSGKKSLHDNSDDWGKYTLTKPHGRLCALRGNGVFLADILRLALRHDLVFFIVRVVGIR